MRTARLASGASQVWSVADGGPVLETLVYAGVWERLLISAQEHGGGAKLGMAFLNGSITRAYRCAADAAKKGTSAKRSAVHCAAVDGARWRDLPEWFGDRGGLSTKGHAATDALGNLMHLLFEPGQCHDATRSNELISGLKPRP